MKSPETALLALVFVVIFFKPGALAGAAGLPDLHQIADRGQSRAFVIATDELQVIGKSQPEKILPAANAEEVRHRAESLSRALGKEVRLVLYPAGKPRNDFTRRILVPEVLVQLEAGAAAQALATANDAKLTRAFEFLPDYFLFTAAEGAGALALAEKLRGQPGVIAAEPQLARLAQKKALPNDPLFAQQWHLRNTGQNGATPGIDIHVTNVWSSFRGAGIYIGIVDDGFQYTHPDLAANANTTMDYDFNFHDLDPAPDQNNNDFHGTAVAGVAAARGNNGIGVCGAAYEAKLVGLRLTSYHTTDADEADAMSHSNAVIQIMNNSWGAADCGPILPTTVEGSGPLMKAALADGVAKGRHGKGVIYVFAGGNGRECGDDVNYDGYANSIHVLAVGAVGDRGNQAFYSEPGACLVVAAPSNDYQGITTTDLTGDDGFNFKGASGELADVNYTKTFGGTSSATPLVSAVIALMLQANPNLGYRDIEEILLRSSTKIQPADADWKTNSAGIAHNHKFGGGLLNAQAAVNLATNWGYLGPVTKLSLLQTNLAIPIPDNNPSGVTRSFTVTNTGWRVEHLTLALTAPHPYCGDLAVTVTSPGGIQSRLAELHGPVDNTTNYLAWTFSSVRHWGEKANGAWTVKVADLYPGVTGTLKAVELNLYGTVPAAMLTLDRTNQHLALNLEAAAPGWKYAIDASTNGLAWTQIIALTIPTVGRTNYTETNVLEPNQRFYRARLLP